VRTLILADLHANWPALEAVLADAEGGYERIVCCGDLVGYNPDPVRVVEWTKMHCNTVIRGNHDKVVAGTEGLEWFNEVAQAAALWTKANLGQNHIEYLNSLPPGPITLEDFEIWHGSPRDEDEYITTVREAIPCFPLMSSPVALFGHTHLQGGFFSRYRRVGLIPAVARKDRELVIELDSESLIMVNPGSVGQPRDNDPRAAYAIFDSAQRIVVLRRVKYPVEKTVAAINRAGLPDVLGYRLLSGV